MKTEHTPGPWAVFDRNPDEIIRDDVMTWSVPHRRICNVFGSTRDGGVNAANARLIAAAPELLEACKLAVDAIDGLSSQQAMPDDSYKPMLAAIESAIAKATEVK